MNIINTIMAKGSKIIILLNCAFSVPGVSVPGDLTSTVASDASTTDTGKLTLYPILSCTVPVSFGGDDFMKCLRIIFFPVWYD